MQVHETTLRTNGFVLLGYIYISLFNYIYIGGYNIYICYIMATYQWLYYGFTII